MQDKHHGLTFGDWGYLAIAKHYQKILKYEVGVLKDNDPEELHQMRVGIRRLRSAIAGFAAAIKLPPDSEKQVGKTGKKLGLLRDIDVLQAILRDHYLPQLPAQEQAHFQPGLEQLTRQRQKVFQATYKFLKCDRYLAFKASFKDWLQQPSYTAIAHLPLEYILPDLLLPEVSHLLLHPGWLIGTETIDQRLKITHSQSSPDVDRILLEQGELLHDLRKTAKRSRYTLELFVSFYDAPYADYLDKIKTLQSVLGDLQDSVVLTDFIKKSFQTDWLEVMPTFAQLLSDLRYQRWQQWQDLQHQFLDLSYRLNFHTALLNPRLTTVIAKN